MSKPLTQATMAPLRSQQTLAAARHRGHALRKSALAAGATAPISGRRPTRCLSQCLLRTLRENNRALASERGRHLSEIAQLGQQVRQLQAENLRLQQQLAVLREGAAGQQLGGSLFELHSHNVRALDYLYRSVTASQKLLAGVQSEFEGPLEASVAAIGEQLSVLLSAYTDPFSQRDMIRRSPLRPLNLATDISQRASNPTAEPSLAEPPKPKPQPAEQQQEAKPATKLPKAAATKRRHETGRPAAPTAPFAPAAPSALAASSAPAEDPFSSRPRLTRTPPRPTSAAASGTGRAHRGGTKRAAAGAAAAAGPPKRRARREVVVDVKVEPCDLGVSAAAEAGDVFEPRSSVADVGPPPTLQGFRDGQQRRRQLPTRSRRAAAK